MKKRLYKKISIGLNLGESEEDIFTFLDKYQDYLHSIYFSLPLGVKYYSRSEMVSEYEGEGAEMKLFRIIRRLPAFGIRAEVAINTYGLNEKDIQSSIDYMIKKDFYPDEIVCLNEYGKMLKNVFPKSELKYSFNNTGKASDFFDTFVVGKGFLRNEGERHKIIERGKGMTLLLNNGCSFECHYPCGDSKFCGSILDKNLKKYTVNYLYALQSFFPSELDYLLDEDAYSNQYRFKLSNRPLGLEFSRRVMDSYCGLSAKTEYELIMEDKINYGLYCVMYELFKRRDLFSLNSICEYKKMWRCKR